MEVKGLRELGKSLKRLDADLPKALRIALNDAADIVVDEARPRVPSASGRARKSVKARSTRTASRVVGGSARAPYYPWLDFGGRVGRNRSVHRPFIADGRYIYAAYFRNRGKYAEKLEEALVDVARRAGVEVT
jgi:hypothetical protein